MKCCIAAICCAFGVGCVTRDPGLVTTQVVSFPDGALVEYGGQSLGRTPVKVTLPQDSEGRLTDRAVVRVLPNSNQPELFPQQRVFEPAERRDRVPNRIMVDMTRGGTNDLIAARRPSTQVETASKKSIRPPVPYTERSKPTQVVGIDRWKPGIY